MAAARERRRDAEREALGKRQLSVPLPGQVIKGTDRTPCEWSRPELRSRALPRSAVTPSSPPPLVRGGRPGHEVNLVPVPGKPAGMSAHAAADVEHTRRRRRQSRRTNSWSGDIRDVHVQIGQLIALRAGGE